MSEIIGIEIGTPVPGLRSAAAASLEAAGVVSFPPADEHVMSLAFDGGARGKTADLRPQLPLLLRW